MNIRVVTLLRRVMKLKLLFHVYREHSGLARGHWVRRKCVWLHFLCLLRHTFSGKIGPPPGSPNPLHAGSIGGGPIWAEKVLYWHILMFTLSLIYNHCALFTLL